MRKKYWSPDCEVDQKDVFKALKEKVNSKRSKSGKFPIRTDGEFIQALIKSGAENIDYLVSL